MARYLDALTREGPVYDRKAYLSGGSAFGAFRKNMREGDKEGLAEFEKDKADRLKSFLASVGFKDKDAAKLAARQAALQTAEIAKLGLPADEALLRKAEQERIEKLGLDERRTRAQEIQANKNPQLETLKWLATQTPEVAARLGKGEKGTKREFEKAEYEAALNRLGVMRVGKGKDTIPMDLQMRIAEGIARGELDPNRVEEYVAAAWPK
jgi:hypothetical protein